jgi:hypothetical protein
MSKDGARLQPDRSQGSDRRVRLVLAGACHFTRLINMHGRPWNLALSTSRSKRTFVRRDFTGVTGEGIGLAQPPLAHCLDPVGPPSEPNRKRERTEKSRPPSDKAINRFQIARLWGRGQFNFHRVTLSTTQLEGGTSAARGTRVIRRVGVLGGFARRAILCTRTSCQQTGETDHCEKPEWPCDDVIYYLHKRCLFGDVKL